MNFTQDEINLLCIYNADSREGTMDELSAMRKELAGDETELRELTDAVLAKLAEISDAEFAALDLLLDFE